MIDHLKLFYKILRKFYVKNLLQFFLIIYIICFLLKLKHRFYGLES